MSTISMQLLGIILFLVHGTTALVSLRIQSNGAVKEWVHINFYDSYFELFLSCLSHRRSLTCTADLARDLKDPFRSNDRRVKGFDKPKLLIHPEIYSDYFTCGYTLPGDDLSCMRLLDIEQQCDSQNMSTYFRLTDNSSLNSDCVGLRWSVFGEGLWYDASAHKIEECDDKCNVTTRNVSDSDREHHNIPGAHFPEHKDDDDDDDNFQHWGPPRRSWEDYNDRKSHIIIAVVVGIVVTAVLIIGAGLFRRMLLRLRARHKAPEEDSAKLPSASQRNQKPSSPKRWFSFTSLNSKNQSPNNKNQSSI